MISEQDNNYLMKTYSRKICLDKGLGSYVFDEKGKKYIDMTGGIATTPLGHNNPQIIESIIKQSVKLINASNLFFSSEQVNLAKKLIEITGMKKCFFSNSGTEAVEAALKLVKKHKKGRIIAMKNGFHGRTHGSLSATWNPKYKKPFYPLVEGFAHVEYGTITELEKHIKGAAAVILEPIQGEAGIIVPPETYLKKVESICKKNKVLLILDEIQTGNGRTGKYFCYQHYNIKPDITITAKGLANGLPIAATISNELDFEVGDHGSTFGGNNLCCAVALKTVEIIEKNLPEIKEKGEYFISSLNSIDSSQIKGVRGKGLMIGIEVVNAELIADKCAEQGLLVNPMHNKILRFLPAYTISKHDIDQVISILEKVLGECHD